MKITQINNNCGEVNNAVRETEVFAVGDMVKLVSGGPVMTVDDVTDSDVWVVWFDGRKCKHAEMPATCLRRATVDEVKRVNEFRPVEQTPEDEEIDEGLKALIGKMKERRAQRQQTGE